MIPREPPAWPLPFASLVLITAGAVLAPLCGCGQSATTPPAAQSSQGRSDGAEQEQNAADEYRSLHAAMGATLIAALSASRGELTPELAGALPAAQPIVLRLVWATGLKRCDWGTDWSEGSRTLLPHLSELRALCRLLRADALSAAHTGNMDTAADRVAAIVRMSRHASGRSMIETLVAYAILSTATGLVQDHAGAWSSSQRRLMLAEFSRIDASDPLHGDASLAHDLAVVARERGLEPVDEPGYRRAKQRTVENPSAALVVLRR